jgi:hypothetical protein
MYSLYSEHYDKIEGEGIVDIQHKHEDEFETWFRHRICGPNAENVSKQLYDLASGPDHQVAMYKGCIVNGVRFHIKDYERTLRTQNSGIVVQGEHNMKNIEFYGELKNILVLRYGRNRVYLFECNWWDVGHRTGIQIDEHFTSVNTSRTWYASDPFVLACQASQVFYLKDPKFGRSWQVVQKVTNINIYDVPTVLERKIEKDGEGIGDEEEDNECVEGNVPVQHGNNVDSTPLRRDDVEPIVIDKVYVHLDEVYVHLDESMFLNDDSVHEEEFSCNSDTGSDDDMC